MKLREGNLVEEVTRGIIVHQVNAQGVMGSGIAKEIRAKYPVVWDDYEDVLGYPYSQTNRGADMLGHLILSKINDDLFVASIVGQQFFGRDGKKYTSYDALDLACQNLSELKADLPIHHPAIGSGLGGGHWPIVASIIEHRLGSDTTLWLLPPR